MTEEQQQSPVTSESQETPTSATDTQPVQTGQDKAFSQADVDRIVGERLKRAESSIEARILESLGVQKLDDAKSLVESQRKAKEAEMSEVEKANARIAEAEKKALEAEKQVAEMQSKVLSDARRGIFADAMRKNGGSDESELYILVQAGMQDDFTAIFDDGDTKADEAKLNAFVKTVQSKFPKYFGTSGAGSPSNSNGVNPTSGIEAIKQAEQETSTKFKI